MVSSGATVLMNERQPFSVLFSYSQQVKFQGKSLAVARFSLFHAATGRQGTLTDSPAGHSLLRQSLKNAL